MRRAGMPALSTDEQVVLGMNAEQLRCRQDLRRATLRNYSNNAASTVNGGERCQNGERISTAFTESTINQVVSKRMVKKP